MKNILFASLVLVMTSATSAFAYGIGGCGLGFEIFGPKDNQVLAATTNGSSGTQSFGISSGTSGCTQDGTVASNSEVPAFVQTNRYALAKDIARGSGETVANLSQMMGCDNAAGLATALQKNYKTIFPSAKASSQEVTGSIVDVVKQSDLNCTNII